MTPWGLIIAIAALDLHLDVEREPCFNFQLASEGLFVLLENVLPR